MIKVILFFLLFIIPLNNIDASEVKLQEIFKGLQSPWSLSFIDNENVILTEKSGNLLHINLIEKKNKKDKAQPRYIRRWSRWFVRCSL